MGKTISHVQGKGSITHNNRTFSAKNVKAELTKNKITFVEMTIEEAYDECFSAVVERYNEKQKRSDRKSRKVTISMLSTAHPVTRSLQLRTSARASMKMWCRSEQRTTQALAHRTQ